MNNVSSTTDTPYSPTHCLSSLSFVHSLSVSPPNDEVVVKHSPWMPHTANNDTTNTATHILYTHTHQPPHARPRTQNQMCGTSHETHHLSYICHTSVIHLQHTPLPSFLYLPTLYWTTRSISIQTSPSCSLWETKTAQTKESLVVLGPIGASLSLISPSSIPGNTGRVKLVSLASR